MIVVKYFSYPIKFYLTIRFGLMFTFKVSTACSMSSLIVNSRCTNWSMSGNNKYFPIEKTVQKQDLPYHRKKRIRTHIQLSVRYVCMKHFLFIITSRLVACVFFGGGGLEGVLMKALGATPVA